MKKTTLSVFIPSYNYEKYIKIAIQSILNQTYTPFELIIIEDASTDGSLKVIEEVTKNCPYKKIIIHEKNRGIIETINEAFSIAKGDFVYGMGADDILTPTFFEKGMKLIEKYPEAGVFCSNFGIFNNDDPSIFTEFPKISSKQFSEKEYFFKPKELEKIFRKTKLTIHGYCTIYNRELALRYGLCDPNLKGLCDWYLAHKIALLHGLGYVPELLTLARIHSSSYGARTLTLFKRWKLNGAILNKINSEEENLQKKIKNSSLLIQLGMTMIFFLLLKPKWWKFLPQLLKKKIKNVILRLKCAEY